MEKEDMMPEQVKKSLFGWRFLDNKNVPVKLLDKMIIGAVALVIILIIVFSLNSGYTVSFISDGGSSVEMQTLKYGEFVDVPANPIKPGYDFLCWVTAEGETWDFSEMSVEDNVELIATWTPAVITVKFDLDGGLINGDTVIDDAYVTYGEVYGELPTPEKEGYSFDGWVYSENIIASDTLVTATSEHILTARWI